jgi:hypothetical protein
MRIASSPTFRIAAGLRLAVLLGVVGNKAFRRLHSQGQDARLKRADAGLWLAGAVQANPLYLSPRQRLHLRSVQKKSGARDRQMSFPSDLISRVSDLKRRPVRLQIIELQSATAVTLAHDELLHLTQ